MKTPLARIAAVSALLSGAVSCGSPVTPGEVLLVGTLLDESQLGYFVPAIEVPDTAYAGSPIVLTVRTMGAGCERLGPTEIQTEGAAVTVTPYDYTSAPPNSGVDCDLVFKTFEHHAVAYLQSVGPVRVTFRTRDVRGNPQEESRTLILLGEPGD